MARPEKSMLTAYILWFFLCGLGVHRMYLKRPLSGMFVAVMNVFGLIMLAIGVVQETQEYLIVGGTTVLAVLVWCLLDAFFIPGMVHHINEPDGDRNFVSLGAVNLDPSHSATMSAVGSRQSEDRRKQALPDDYERPWQTKSEKPTVVRYRSRD